MDMSSVNYTFDDEEIEEEFDPVDEGMLEEEYSNGEENFDFDDDYDSEDYVDDFGEEGNDFGADEMGADVDLVAEGLADDAIKDYRVLGVDDNNFINSNGDIVVMDPDDKGDSFELKYIPIENITVVPRIRKLKNVEDLVQSIRSTGLLQPIVVAPSMTEDLYVLIAGYRRLIACAKVGIRNVPAIVNKKIATTEIPILEALYNHSSRYSIKEIVDYIDYLEKEKGIVSSSMIEYLLQLDNGDYAKLKDVLEDDDPDIVDRLMNGQWTIAQAFKNLENRRKKESKEEKEIKKAARVYADAEETGANKLVESGETGDEDVALTDEEIASLAISAGELASADEEDLSAMIEEGNNIEGYQPHRQDPDNRERLDPALRKAVLARDNNTCQVCKMISGQEFTEVLDVHHIHEVYLGGTDDIDNLVTACVVCHKLIHLWARGELFIRPIEEMDEKEQNRFKRVVKLGNVIRKGMALKGIKREQLKKLDKAETIGRTLRGSSEQVAG